MTVELSENFLNITANHTVEETHQFKRIRPDETSYCEFYSEHLVANQPCLLTSEWTQHWRSRTEWVLDGKPNLSFMQQHFGEALVPVADCNVKHYNSQMKCDMTMKEYVAQFKHNSNLYLKDWHFMRDFPEYKAYQTPHVFASDWLNEFWMKTAPEDDYRFVYIGPKGTWTPLHTDVFSSYSWSANITGHKTWLFFPPSEANNLSDDHGNLIYDYSDDVLRNSGRFTRIHEAKPPIKVTQAAGEVIFVPSGWIHQVFNDEDTISINHNWYNASNIGSVWKALQRAYNEVVREIADCSDMDGWSEHCQVMLKAVHGMNYTDFYTQLQFIAESRVKLVESEECVEFDNWELGRHHALYDLKVIHCLLQDVVNVIHDGEENDSNELI